MLIVLLVACGAPPDNTAACQAWLAEKPCNTDFSGEFDCAHLGSESCDLQPYFDCLSSHVTCDGDGHAVTDWGTCAAFTCPQ